MKRSTLILCLLSLMSIEGFSGEHEQNYITCSLDELNIKSRELDKSVEKFFKYDLDKHIGYGGVLRHKYRVKHLNISTWVVKKGEGYEKKKAYIEFNFSYEIKRLFNPGRKVTGNFQKLFSVNQIKEGVITKKIELKRDDFAQITCEHIETNLL